MILEKDSRFKRFGRPERGALVELFRCADKWLAQQDMDEQVDCLQQWLVRFQGELAPLSIDVPWLLNENRRKSVSDSKD